MGNQKTAEDIINSFKNQSFMKFLGARISVDKPGKCKIFLKQSENLTQQHGLFHGGVISALADNSAAFAATTLMEKNKEPLTVEFKVNFINIADGFELWAEGEVLSAGTRIYHAESKIYTNSNGNAKLCAVALATIKATSRVEEIPLES